MSNVQDIMGLFTIKSQKCDYCGQVAVGTLVKVTSDVEGEFACANCDRENFEAASEQQKEAYLSGEFNPNYSC